MERKELPILIEIPIRLAGLAMGVGLTWLLIAGIVDLSTDLTIYYAGPLYLIAGGAATFFSILIFGLVLIAIGHAQEKRELNRTLKGDDPWT